MHSAAAHRHLLAELGARIRRARRAASVTQELVAGRAGIEYKRYQRIEAGRVNVTVRTLARIADALETDLWNLLRH